MQRMINTHIEASKIGRQIADQIIDSQKRGDLSNEGTPEPEAVPSVTNTEVRTNKYNLQR